MRLQTALGRWAVDSVDIVQLREKGLNTGELFALATAAVDTLRGLPGNLVRPRLLISTRVDIALAAEFDGVHLSAQPGALTPAQVRTVFAGAGRQHYLISSSCHTLEEVAQARDGGADLILFGPVFEKSVAEQIVVEGKGLPLLREACRRAWPARVLALGGVTPARWNACGEAGAVGFASIRAFASAETEAVQGISPHD